MKNIILGVTGSISAYKSADITSQLVKKGHTVHVVLTKAASAFITPLTLQALSKQPVYTDVTQEADPKSIKHIDLIKAADLLLVAPATANIIGKFASGVADDMLSTLFLVIDPKKVVIAPAMNTQMYLHPIVVTNMQKLKKLGVRFIDPKEGLLACGDIGIGALANVDTICSFVEQQ